MKLPLLKAKRFGESTYLKAIASAWPALTLLGILAAAFFFRVYGIKFGLPYIYHPDELSIVDRSLTMLRTGDFSPHWFTWPSLYFYVQALVYALRSLYLSFKGISVAYTGIAASTELAGFYLWGRFATVLLGTATVALTFWVGKKVFNKKVGLLGALFLAFSLEHVEYSHYITTDVPVAFFALITVLFALLILEKGDTKYYILGGLLAGLTAATKYQAVLVFSCIFFAGLMRLLAGEKEYRKILYSIIALGGGFLIGMPYAIIEASTFLSDIGGILEHYGGGHLSAQGTANWWYYLVYFYREGMGKGILILSICGLIFIAIKSNQKRFLCLIFVILLFTRIYSAKVRFARNLMPLLPFFSLFAAFFLSYWLDWWGKRDFVKKRKFLQIPVSVVLIGGLLFTPTTMVWNWTYKKAHNEINPRTLAKEWVESHIPAGTAIATEWFTAPLNQFDSKRRYRLVEMDFLARRNIDWYREREVSYVIASIGYERSLAEWRNFPYYIWIPNYEEMLHHLELLKEIGDIKIYRVKPEGTKVG